MGHQLGKVNHLHFMDDLKLYRQNKKQVDKLVDTVQIFSENIGMEFRISKCTTLFLTAIWLSHSQLWAILKGTASLTQC